MVGCSLVLQHKPFVLTKESISLKSSIVVASVIFPLPMAVVVVISVIGKVVKTGIFFGFVIFCSFLQLFVKIKDILSMTTAKTQAMIVFFMSIQFKVNFIEFCNWGMHIKHTGKCITFGVYEYPEESS